MTIRIYLAGPDVFSPYPIAEGERLKKICKDHGLTGVFPMDSALDLSGLSKQVAAQKIYLANIDLIDSCQGVLANMQDFRGPGMDGGTAFEMGYARARGLKIIGYGAEKTYLERCQDQLDPLIEKNDRLYDSQDMEVEDFDLTDNLMMACSVDGLAPSFEEACLLIKGLCESA